ncbi:MAG TPA: hypothetical protein VN222_11635, partial [Novosphingobium sp.]|nr:hypothetical protein [Novosphingobium sp.]
PPPKPVVVIPPRPTPPNGSTLNVAIPAVGADGVRHTILVDSLDAQRVWNLRSAFNVAALNCTAPQYGEIIPAYSAFLKKHAKALNVANRGVDAVFRKKYAKGFVAERERYMTQVYNYFAYPPTLPQFCASALEMSRESGAVASKDLPEFSERSFTHFIAVYEDFYRAYEKYRADLADWEAHYGTQSSAVQPATPVAAAPAPGAPARN